VLVSIECSILFMCYSVASKEGQHAKASAYAFSTAILHCDSCHNSKVRVTMRVTLSFNIASARTRLQMPAPFDPENSIYMTMCIASDHPKQIIQSSRFQYYLLFTNPETEASSSRAGELLEPLACYQKDCTRLQDGCHNYCTCARHP
jgi:hypothetical protein